MRIADMSRGHVIKPAKPEGRLPKLVDGRHLKCLGLRPCGFDSHSGHHSISMLIGVRQISDTLTRSERSERMSRIRARDTGPEMVVRKLLHRLGYRFRLHAKELPGRPDIVFRRRKLAVFVHGCFWHRHDDPGCKLARLPKSRLHFWVPKLEGNRKRDLENQRKLEALGWSVLVVWECEVAKMADLQSKLVEALAKR